MFTSLILKYLFRGFYCGCPFLWRHRGCNPGCPSLNPALTLPICCFLPRTCLLASQHVRALITTYKQKVYGFPFDWKTNVFARWQIDRISEFNSSCLYFIHCTRWWSASRISCFFFQYIRSSVLTFKTIFFLRILIIDYTKHSICEFINVN